MSFKTDIQKPIPPSPPPPPTRNFYLVVLDRSQVSVVLERLRSDPVTYPTLEHTELSY